MADATTKRNEAALEKLFKALSGKNPDWDTVASMFAPDGYWWPLTPVSAQYKGGQAIAAELKRQLALAGDLDVSPPHALVSSGNRVVYERTDYVTVTHTQKRVGLRICSVLEFDDAAKITAWREYFDMAFCQKSMGFENIPVSELVGATGATH
jgi:limonene-1,2-epoxide hydrolase